MTGIFIRLILIAVMLICPLCCQWGTCCAAWDCIEPQSVESECTEDCCESDRSDHAPQPPRDDAPCSIIQCICSGAVLEQNENEATQQTENSLEVAVTGSLIADVVIQLSMHRRLLCFGRSTLGQRLCILHMSLLM